MEFSLRATQKSVVIVEEEQPRGRKHCSASCRKNLADTRLRIEKICATR